MKTKLIVCFLTAIFMIALVSTGFTQNLNLADLAKPDQAHLETQYAQANLDELIDPLLDLFGFYSGGGLAHTADIHGLGGFDIGVRLVTMMVKDEQKPPIPWPQNPADPKYTQGIFEGMTLMPLPLLQASLGLPGNIEATGRFFTYPIGEGETKGNITLIGLGVKYGLLQQMMLPKVAIVAAYHYLTVPSDFDFGNVSCISGGVIASYGIIPIVDIYGGIGIDYNKFQVDLQLPEPIGKVSKSFTKQNMRYNLGLKVSPIPLLYIHADYNFGPVQGFNVGLGVSFR